MTIALAGMTMERKATSSSTKLRLRDDRQRDRQPAVEEVEVVDHAGGVAGHVDLGRACRRRPPARWSVRRCLTRACVASPAGSPASGGRDQRQVAGLVDGRPARVRSGRRCFRAASRRATPCLTLRRRRRAVDHDLQRVGLAQREVAVEDVPALLGVLVGRAGSAALMLVLPVFMTRTGEASDEQDHDGHA